MGEKMSLGTLEKEEVELKNRLEMLNEKKKQLYVSEGVSIICSRCKRYVRSPNANELKENICWRCITEQRNEKKRKKVLNRLKGARLVNLKVSDGVSYSHDSIIESITVYKDNVLFEFTPDSDYDSHDSWINMDETKSSASPHIIDRPGTKPRDKDKVLDIRKRGKKNEDN